MKATFSMKCEKCDKTMQIVISNVNKSQGIIDVSFIRSDLKERLKSNHDKGYHESELLK